MLAFAVLIVSVYRTTSAKLVYGKDLVFTYLQDFSPSPLPYTLPTELNYYPDDPRWTLKALEDKIVLETSFDNINKSQFMRKNADERLVAGVKLLQDKDTSLGLSYLAKAEEYLANSFLEVKEINSLEARAELQEISLASLKHREVLEHLLAQSPDTIKSQVFVILEKSKLTYKESRVVIELFGDKAPKNIFDEN